MNTINYFIKVCSIVLCICFCVSSEPLHMIEANTNCLSPKLALDLEMTRADNDDRFFPPNDSYIGTAPMFKNQESYLDEDIIIYKASRSKELPKIKKPCGTVEIKKSGESNIEISVNLALNNPHGHTEFAIALNNLAKDIHTGRNQQRENLIIYKGGSPENDPDYKYLKPYEESAQEIGRTVSMLPGLKPHEKELRILDQIGKLVKRAYAPAHTDKESRKKNRSKNDKLAIQAHEEYKKYKAQHSHIIEAKTQRLIEIAAMKLQERSLGFWIKNKCGVCRHHALLFQHLCAIAGLVEKVNGDIVPRVKYKSGIAISSGRRHAWNSIRLCNGKKKIIDTYSGDEGACMSEETMFGQGVRDLKDKKLMLNGLYAVTVERDKSDRYVLVIRFPEGYDPTNQKVRINGSIVFENAEGYGIRAASGNIIRNFKRIQSNVYEMDETDFDTKLEKIIQRIQKPKQPQKRPQAPVKKALPAQAETPKPNIIKPGQAKEISIAPESSLMIKYHKNNYIILRKSSNGGNISMQKFIGVEWSYKRPLPWRKEIVFGRGQIHDGSGTYVTLGTDEEIPETYFTLKAFDTKNPLLKITNLSRENSLEIYPLHKKANVMDISRILCASNGVRTSV